MPTKRHSSLCRAAAALGLVLVLAGCTKGGQFDPTTLFDADVFDSKTKLKGDRVPVFPNGVPGTTTGVPADLVKGYQPPPEADAETPAPAPAEAAKPNPKPKPKPKVAVARSSSQPTRISVGAKTGTPPEQTPPRPSVWPASPPTMPAQQAAQPSQSVWPASPPTMPAQQAAQPSQSIWPNPPPTGTTSR